MTPSKKISKDDQNVENNIEQLLIQITHCTDIEELEELFVTENLNIKKEYGVMEETDGYYCDTCFEGTKPEFSIQSSGAFKFDRVENRKLESDGAKQSREFLNLKKDLKRHLISKTHKQKVDILNMKTKMDKERLSREYRAGMNVWRERYEGIKQGKSRLCFEKDMLRAKLNGCEVGDTNHSDDFAKKIDDSTYSVIKDDMRKSMRKELDATEKKRPAGLLMDKMTPNKRTGQMHAVVIPIPENPLSKDFLKPMMLDVTPVPDPSAEGLAKSSKEVFNNAGKALQYIGQCVDVRL